MGGYLSLPKAPEECSAWHLRQFLEKLLDHHFGRSIDQALADGRDRTPYLRVSFVGHLGTSVSRPELQQSLAFSTPTPPRALAPQPETRRRRLIGDPHLALESAGKARQRHVHLHPIFAFAGFLQPLTTRNCARQDFRVLHHLVGTFGRKRQRIRAGNLHVVLASAAINARVAWTTARCRRNWAEACKSEFASTPFTTSAAAF